MVSSISFSAQAKLNTNFKSNFSKKDKMPNHNSQVSFEGKKKHSAFLPTAAVLALLAVSCDGTISPAKVIKSAEERQEKIESFKSSVSANIDSELAKSKVNNAINEFAQKTLDFGIKANLLPEIDSIDLNNDGSYELVLNQKRYSCDDKCCKDVSYGKLTIDIKNQTIKTEYRNGDKELLCFTDEAMKEQSKNGIKSTSEKELLQAQMVEIMMKLKDLEAQEQ